MSRRIGLLLIILVVGAIGAAWWFVAPVHITGKIIQANTPGCFQEWGPTTYIGSSFVRPSTYDHMEYEMDCTLVVETDSGTAHIIKFSDSYRHAPDAYYYERVTPARTIANELTIGKRVAFFLRRGFGGFYRLNGPEDYIIHR